MWHVYILHCADDTLYTGITIDIARRLEEHNHTDKGAKYTRTRRPVSLVYSESCDSRSTAASREYAIKGLTKLQKRALIRGDSLYQ